MSSLIFNRAINYLELLGYALTEAKVGWLVHHPDAPDNQWEPYAEFELILLAKELGMEVDPA